MNKAQHTPAPWTIDGIYIKDSYSNYIAKMQVFGAWMNGLSPSQYANPEIFEANARLIAAAPEMLAMLKRIFKVMPSRMEEGGQLLEGEIAALIAKATGE